MSKKPNTREKSVEKQDTSKSVKIPAGDFLFGRVDLLKDDPDKPENALDVKIKKVTKKAGGKTLILLRGEKARGMAGLEVLGNFNII